jgi:hypothetical protein
MVHYFFALGIVGFTRVCAVILKLRLSYRVPGTTEDAVENIELKSFPPTL